MLKSIFVRGGLGALLTLALCVPALADEALTRAQDLYAAQNYKAAQEAALQVDASKLTDVEKAQLEELKNALPEAIVGSERATADLDAATKAYDKGEWDAAQRFYKSVEANNFANDAQLDQARSRLTMVAAKKQLGDAAKPDGTVTTTVVYQEAPAARPVDVKADETDSSRLTPVQEMMQMNELNWQRAVAQAEDLMNKARAAADSGDFVAARQASDQAIQKIEAARNFASPVSKYNTARDTAMKAKQDVEAKQNAAGVTAAEAERRQIQDRIRERERLLKQQKEEKIQQLFATAKQLNAEKRYGEAVEALRQILFIDPSNAKARAQLEWAEDSRSFGDQQEWYRDLSKQFANAITKADETLIPWDYEVLYPRNWLEITQKRGLHGIGPGGSAVDSELERRLSEPLPQIDFQSQPLEQVFGFLGEMTHITFSVDWEDLTNNGISRDKEVSLKMSGLKFRVVLDQLLTTVGGDVKLAFRAGDGLIRIATKDKLDKSKEVRVYDIRDLLIDIPRFSARASIDPAQALQSAMGGGGGNLFTGNQEDQQDRNQPGQQSPIVGQILDIIRQTVEPDSWRETGGGDGSLRELNGQLIVYNTSDAHRQVVDLLNQLRATQSLQISVETRFLNVVSNFLEQFGVDLDFVFNSGNAGFDRGINSTGGALVDPATGANILIPRQFSRIGSLPNSPAFGQPMLPFGGQTPVQPYSNAGLVPRQGGVVPGISEMTPISVQQGSLGLVDPSQINTNVPGSWAQRSGLAPALAITGTFLDNLQVDFLIRATQANSHSSIVQAPRLVLFNGQRSRIQIGRSRGYVSTVTPVVAEGAVGVRPTVQQAVSGTELIVDGTISADHKYVTMTIRTTQSDEPQFERFEIQRASGSSPGIFVMLLDQTFSHVETTVSIPDGGTVLLGGVKQVGEVEVEAGVPILSKIPILKRAFSNTTTVKDTRTLLILVKAKIIIQKEAENEAFPSLASGG